MLLEVQELSWIPTGADRPVWEGVSFSVDRGELVVLEGPSGSGKSTLLRGIVGLEEITSGVRRWRGDIVDADNIRRFRHRAVYVHQTPQAIAPRIEANLSFPREISRQFDEVADEPMDEGEQRELLDRFGLEGLDFERRFDELSVGEQQRVALVRCLTVRPQLLLLDEPTASLDPDNAGRVEQFIVSYLDESDDRSAIWISHDRQQRRRLAGRTIDIEQWTIS